jgi:hypothetical protein
MRALSIFALLLSFLSPVRVAQAAQSLPATIRVGQTCSCSTCNTVITMSLETYVKHVLPSEWIASWNAEALKAGAVAIRSYGASYCYRPISTSYDICDNTCCQVYGNTTNAATDAAVDATAGVCEVDSSGNIARTEYSAENNNSGTCGDGFIINNPATPCLSDSVCAGTATNGHGRGMCQWGTQRWAANQGKTYDWICDHYFNNYGFTRQQLTSSDVLCKSVTVSNITDTGATITWTTNINSDSVVEYGTTTAYGSSTSNATLTTNHSITLSGLSFGVTYHFRVKSTASGNPGNSGDSTFTTGQIILDNTAAAFAGTWSTGTSSSDKYGADYRYHGATTAADSATFTPSIANAGTYDVYEWHPQGTNRSTGAPYTITYSGGSQRVTVNQQINGGKWNLLGTFAFAAGTAGNVKVTCDFTDTANLAMADAVRFAPSGPPPPPPPTAPSGLGATAAGTSQINLAWTDNSTDESNFVVARSTVAGGPYTDIATLAANTTSYSNTGLSASTTYYYVVRATNANGASANSNQASATTAAPPATPVHVNSITMSFVKSGGRFKTRAVVNVKNGSGANVANATVTGNFSGAISETGKTAVTDASGNATINSTGSIQSGTVTFTVTNVAGTGLTYDSAANVVSSGTISR